MIAYLSLRACRPAGGIAAATLPEVAAAFFVRAHSAPAGPEPAGVRTSAEPSDRGPEKPRAALFRPVPAPYRRLAGPGAGRGRPGRARPGPAAAAGAWRPTRPAGGRTRGVGR